MATRYIEDFIMWRHPYQWLWANSAARAAQTVDAGDLYKRGFQIDTLTEYILTDESPVVWTTPSGGGGGSGTVTSVAMTVPPILSVAGSPVTTSGTLALTLPVQNANLVWAGPSSGAAASPTFRTLALADAPFLGGAAVLNVGASAGTVAAGDDSRLSDARTPTTHKTSHESGGSDALTGNLDANARVSVRKNSAGSVSTRRRLNLIEGSGVTLTVADDSGNEEIDITIDAAGGGTQTNSTLATAAGTATCTNTTTETSITPSVSGSLTIVANAPVQYETYRFVFRGHHSVVTGGATYAQKLYFGSTVVAQTSSLFTGACTNRAWEVTVDVVVTTTGASGAVWAFGTNTRFTAASTVVSAEMVGTTASATTAIDFTADQAVTLKVTYTSANASNTITCTHATMTRMKS